MDAIAQTGGEVEAHVRQTALARQHIVSEAQGPQHQTRHAHQAVQHIPKPAYRLHHREQLHGSQADRQVGDKDPRRKGPTDEQHLTTLPSANGQIGDEKEDRRKGTRIDAVDEPGDSHGSQAQAAKAGENAAGRCGRIELRPEFRCTGSLVLLQHLAQRRARDLLLADQCPLAHIDRGSHQALIRRYSQMLTYGFQQLGIRRLIELVHDDLWVLLLEYVDEQTRAVAHVAIRLGHVRNVQRRSRGAVGAADGLWRDAGWRASQLSRRTARCWLGGGTEARLELARECAAECIQILIGQQGAIQ